MMCLKDLIAALRGELQQYGEMLARLERIETPRREEANSSARHAGANPGQPASGSDSQPQAQSLAQVRGKLGGGKFLLS